MHAPFSFAFTNYGKQIVADEALYRAKAHGCNRVELAGDETVTLVPELPGEDVTPVTPAAA